MQHKWDVFISYSSKDRNLVSIVEADLRNAGIIVWRDASQVAPGDRIRERINQGIRNSRSILIFVSKRSLQSRWVLNELDAAMLREIAERRVVVIPALIGRVEVEDLPEDLRGKSCIDLRQDFRKKYDATKRELILFLRSPTTGDASDEGSGPVILRAGDELAAFFLNYRPEFTQDIVAGMHALTDSFLEQWSKEDLPDDALFYPWEDGRRFIERYGLDTVRKIFLFFAEKNGITTSDWFGVKQVEETIDETAFMTLVFAIQEDMAAPNGEQLLVSISDDRAIALRRKATEGEA